MLTKRQIQFISKWRKIHDAGRFNYFLKCAAIAGIAGLIVGVYLSFPDITKLVDTFNNTEVAAERADTFYHVLQMVGGSVISLSLAFGFFASGLVWSANENQYHKLKVIHEQSLLKPTQIWGLRLGLHLAIINDDTDPSLYSNFTEEELKGTLKRDWNVNNREDALEKIDWLIKDGHRTFFKNEKIVAWDFGRLVSLARFFYTAKYITERDAWQLIKFAANTVQPLFNSWEEYHNSYAMGRKLWRESWGQSEESGQFMLKVQKNLNDADKSLVKNLPWKMLLTWEVPFTGN